VRAHLVPEVVAVALGLVLDMTLRDIERVLYFEAYVVVDPGMTPLKKFSIMSEDDFDAKRTEFGDEFVALMGAGACTSCCPRSPRHRDRAPARRHDRLRAEGQKRTPSA